MNEGTRRTMAVGKRRGEGMAFYYLKPLIQGASHTDRHNVLFFVLFLSCSAK